MRGETWPRWWTKRSVLHTVDSQFSLPAREESRERRGGEPPGDSSGHRGTRDRFLLGLGSGSLPDTAGPPAQVFSACVGPVLGGRLREPSDPSPAALGCRRRSTCRRTGTSLVEAAEVDVMRRYRTQPYRLLRPRTHRSAGVAPRVTITRGAGCPPGHATRSGQCRRGTREHVPVTSRRTVSSLPGEDDTRERPLGSGPQLRQARNVRGRRIDRQHRGAGSPARFSDTYRRKRKRVSRSRGQVQTRSAPRA